MCLLVPWPSTTGTETYCLVAATAVRSGVGERRRQQIRARNSLACKATTSSAPCPRHHWFRPRHRDAATCAHRTLAIPCFLPRSHQRWTRSASASLSANRSRPCKTLPNLVTIAGRSQKKKRTRCETTLAMLTRRWRRAGRWCTSSRAVRNRNRKSRQLQQVLEWWTTRWILPTSLFQGLLLVLRLAHSCQRQRLLLSPLLRRLQAQWLIQRPILRQRLRQSM